MIVDGRNASVVTTVLPSETKLIAFAPVAIISAVWLVVIEHESGQIRKSIISSLKSGFEENDIQGTTISAKATADLVDNKITLFVENQSAATVSVRAKLLYSI